jgi:hypothetical protein
MMSPDQLRDVISSPSSTLQQKLTAEKLLDKLTKPATVADPTLEALIRLYRDKLAYYSQIVREGGRGNVNLTLAQQVVTRCEESLAQATKEKN